MNEESGKSRLIAGITEDARKEAEKITESAKKAMEDRKASIETQIIRIKTEAAQKAEEQAAFIRKNSKSSIAVEKKRLSLRMMDRIVNSTVEKAKERIYNLINTPEYPEILAHWIVEAAIGLNTDQAEVNSSQYEIAYLTDELLKRAGDIFFDLTGKNIILEKSAAGPLLAQGIVLTAKDGKTAFNNQVPTRILRHQSEVRKMIFNILNEEN